MLSALRARIAQPAARQLLSSARPSSSSALFLSSSRSLHLSSWRLATHTIPVPSVADSISEGTLAELAVSEGGAVSVDQVIAKLETDKVTIDIRSTVGGKATKWHSKVGETVKIGAPLLDVELGAAGTAAAPAAPAAAPKPLEPVLHLNPASAPSADTSKNAPPLAQSGAQPPAATNPTDPSDGEHRRQPSIVFRYGKRDASGSRGGHPSHQHQGNQIARVVGMDFLAANEAAAAAMAALPARYKKKTLKAADLAIIELGGASNYESKKKARA